MAETVFKMPLTNVPQRFSMDIAGTTYTIVCRWNEVIGWALDLIDAATDTSIIACLPIVTGCDLLTPFGYLNIGASLIAYTDGDQYEPPTLDNLGAESNLYILITT